MADKDEMTLEQCIARKLMLDIRFFDDGTGSAPVTRLPAALEQGLAALAPGGVILFRENIDSVAQCRALTDQVRRVLGAEALIAVDQEGGRVTRLPRDQVTSFSGNMALAACAAQEREELARAMGRAQGEELAALGINVNFAPTLDVNSNPANPVINVRAFADEPTLVATLGAAVVRGLQEAGVAAAVKHFPGHGDTSLDSHTDLPCVARDAQAAREIDLAPFAAVIRSAPPAMVMTAHIQYPALDASTLPGTGVVRPATLSRALLTDLLRNDWGYGGVVISDALDMAAISELMSPVDAVLACFGAGVDIALMPLRVRSAQSLVQLEELVAAVAGAVRSGDLDESEIRESASRVQAAQQRYCLPASATGAAERIACAEHLALERRIAGHSVTLLHGSLVSLAGYSRVHLLMPTAASARALVAALERCEPGLRISWQALEQFDAQAESAGVAAADIYVVGVSEPAPGAVDIGGAEDLASLDDRSPASVQKQLLRLAEGRERVVILLQSPYPAAEYADLADTVLATYDAAPLGFGGAPGPAYCALADVLTGARTPDGQLPVRLQNGS